VCESGARRLRGWRAGPGIHPSSRGAFACREEPKVAIRLLALTASVVISRWPIQGRGKVGSAGSIPQNSGVAPVVDAQAGGRSRGGREAGILVCEKAQFSD